MPPPGSPPSTRPSSTWSSRARRCTSARCRIFRRTARRVRLRPPRRAHRAADRGWCRATGRRCATCPGDLARPVWVDDADFDVAYHVRRSALPRPGTPDAAHRAGRPADVAAARPGPPAVGDLPGRGPRRRPLRDDHQDPPGDGRRRHAIDIGQVLLDADARSRARCPRSCGCRGPSRRTPRLVVDAVAEAIARPGRAGRHRRGPPPTTRSPRRPGSPAGSARWSARS